MKSPPPASQRLLESECMDSLPSVENDVVEDDVVGDDIVGDDVVKDDLQDEDRDKDSSGWHS